ncbi:hypothetical protein TRAPUB_12606 [Trametes pubescens]|uniref:Uncharacterized protein n=1 Tax=Trametes pubescens TaxID=154538 RepID=A0A1M2VTD7_TRAPU|nr:hypothetical protein TRAPUB_12606 [Trametes pubescens]
MTLYISYWTRAPKVLPACIASLTTWLSSDPLPAFARVLEDLRIVIEGPVQDLFLGSIGSEALSNVALALLPSAYPALAAFRVVHHRWQTIPETLSGALSEEEVAGSIAQALAPLREARVRVDVGTTMMPSEMFHTYGGPADAFL